MTVVKGGGFCGEVEGLSKKVKKKELFDRDNSVVIGGRGMGEGGGAYRGDKC